MYEIDIPKEIRQDIITVINRNKNRLSWPHADMKYAMTIYYRYIAKPHSYETVEQRVNKDISCGNCRLKAVARIKQQIQKWNEQGTETKANK